MRKIIKFISIGSLILVGGVILLWGIREFLYKRNDKGGQRILLLGASVGKAWNLRAWPRRTGREGYIFEMLPIYSFDKSERLEDIFIRPKRKISLNKRFVKSLLKPVPRKPDVIILKQCAAYFPGDLERYKVLMKKWIDLIRQKGIKVVVTTVVPVTKKHALRKPGRLEKILEYNEWIREVADQENIFCLDLEEALRMDGSDRRSLDPELAAEDGLHLNKKAYEILDGYLLDRLEKVAK